MGRSFGEELGTCPVSIEDCFRLLQDTEDVRARIIPDRSRNAPDPYLMSTDGENCYEVMNRYLLEEPELTVVRTGRMLIYELSVRYQSAEKARVSGECRFLGEPETKNLIDYTV